MQQTPCGCRYWPHKPAEKSRRGFESRLLHQLIKGVIMPKLTDEEIMKIWSLTPAQNDPTGKKFALAFAKVVLSEEERKENQ